DRYFIDKLATRVFEIGDGQVQVFPGNYEDYLWRKQGQTESSNAAPMTVSAKPALPIEEEPATEARQKRVNPIKLRQMKERCQELEEEVARLEAAIADTENALQSFVSERLKRNLCISNRRFQ